MFSSSYLPSSQFLLNKVLKKAQPHHMYLPTTGWVAIYHFPLFTVFQQNFPDRQLYYNLAQCKAIMYKIVKIHIYTSNAIIQYILLRSTTVICFFFHWLPDDSVFYFSHTSTVTINADFCLTLAQVIVSPFGFVYLFFSLPFLPPEPKAIWVGN